MYTLKNQRGSSNISLCIHKASRSTSGKRFVIIMYMYILYTKVQCGAVQAVFVLLHRTLHDAEANYLLIPIMSREPGAAYIRNG